MLDTAISRRQCCCRNRSQIDRYIRQMMWIGVVVVLVVIALVNGCGI